MLAVPVAHVVVDVLVAEELGIPVEGEGKEQVASVKGTARLVRRALASPLSTATHAPAPILNFLAGSCFSYFPIPISYLFLYHRLFHSVYKQD